MAWKDVGKWWNDVTGATAAMEAQQRYNAEQAAIQRDFEERMANTAIQRQAADAKAAGVNSAMLFANSSASGASTPNGSSANSSAINSGNISSVLNSAASLINAHTAQLRQDRDSKHLDYKEKERLDYQTQSVYNSAGRLLRRVVSERNSSR